MFNFIIVTLFFGYGLILIFGLVHLARDLVTTPFPHLHPDADFEVDQNPEILGPFQSRFAPLPANQAIGQRCQKGGPP